MKYDEVVKVNGNYEMVIVYIYIYTKAMIKIDEGHTPDTSFLGAQTLPFAFCALYLYL